MLEDLLLAPLLTGGELQLAAQHRGHGVEVDGPGDGARLPRDRRATQGRGRDRLRGGHREPGRHTGRLVDRGRLAQVSGEPGDDLDQVPRHVGDECGLLLDERDLVAHLERVVGADLGTEAVLERGDDPPAVGVVLRVRAGDQQHVQGQPQRVAAHLDVALLHDVEQRDLDAFGEVGQLVDRDDTAVRARDQPEMDGLRVTERAALGHLDRVDVADQVGDGGVGCRELLGVALGTVPPLHGQGVAQLGGAADRGGGDGFVGVLAELGAGDDGSPLVEQADEGAEQPGLALAALAQQDEVVAGEQGALELGQHGRLEADDAGPGIAALAQGGEEVLAEFGLDVALRVTGGAQRAEGVGKIGRECDGHVLTLRRRRRGRSSKIVADCGQDLATTPRNVRLVGNARPPRRTT